MIASSEVPTYIKAPMTHGRAGKLARLYGYPNLGSFADAIPVGANIMDLGAGGSKLGLKVCRLREDIRWLNVDIRYTNPKILKRVAKRVPPNLEFLGADALNLVDAVGPRRFDRLYSNWMLTHIILESRELGLIAARNMIEVVEPTGQLAVGPCVGFPARSDEAMTAEISDYSSNPESLAQELVYTIGLSPRDARGQVIFNNIEYALDRFNPRSTRL